MIAEDGSTLTENDIGYTPKTLIEVITKLLGMIGKQSIMFTDFVDDR